MRQPQGLRAAAWILPGAMLVLASARAAPSPAKPVGAAPSGKLAGRVTRTTDGAGVASAAIEATPSEGGSARSTRSAPDGTWTIDKVAEGYWDVRVAARGLVAGGAWHVEVPAHAQTTADVALSPGGTLTGLVLDAGGAPLAGASVEHEGDTARTDAAGRYRLAAVAPGPASLQVSAAGRVAASIADLTVVEGAVVEAPPLTMERAGAFTGRVTDAATGKPLKGAQLGFYGDGIDGSWGNATTDAQGRFRVDGLRAGPHAFSVSLEGFDFMSGKGVEAVAGRDVEIPPVALAQRPPMLKVYANQKVFLPGQRVRASFNAYRVKTFTVSAYPLDPQPWIAKGSLAGMEDAPLTGAKPARSLTQRVSYERVHEEVHGRGLVLEPLAPGFWILRVTGDAGLTSSTWVQVSDLSMISKETDRDTLLFAQDLATSQPRPEVEVWSWPEGTMIGTTRADGMLWARREETSPRPFQLLLARDRHHPEQVALLHATDPEAPETPAAWRAYVETDRPLYRPGHQVGWKCTLRADDRGRYAVQAPSKVKLTVTDATGARLIEKDVTPSPTGSFDGTIDLPEEAPLGSYEIALEITSRGDAPDGVTQEGGTFRVEAYRKPEMKVTASLTPAQVVGGDALHAAVAAEYGFGGGVAGARVEYDVYSTPWPSWSLFPEDAPCEDCWDGWEPEGWEDQGYGTLVTHGEATTDAQGHVSFDVETKRPVGGDERWQIVTRVQDPTGREVRDTATALVSRASIAVSVLAGRDVVRPDESVAVTVRAARFDGTPAAAEATLRVIEQRWAKGHSTDTVLQEIPVSIGDTGRAEFSVTPGRSGSIELYVVAHDDKARLTDASAWLWSVGPGSRIDEVPGRDLQIVTDRASYAPGDTARVLVTSAVPDAFVLLTVEGERIHDARLLHLEGATAVTEIAMADAVVPTAHLRATLVSGKRFRETGKALAVSPEDHVLKVEVAADQPVHHPGDKAAFTVTTRDSKGRGVPAEVSLAVVDESIFQLSRELTPDVRLAFYGPRENRVRTTHSFPRIYEGGADKWKEGQRRRRFRDTALWAPRVLTGPDGTAHVDFDLPDDLATWRATARAITSDTKVGQALGKTISRKELMVRLDAPRFFVTGDVAHLRAAVHDETDAPLRVQWRARVEGAEIVGPSSGGVDVGAHAEAGFDLVLRAGAERDVTIRLDTAAPPLADGVELKIPSLAFGEVVTSAASGSTRDKTTATLNLPDGADARATQLDLRVSPSLAAGLYESLDALNTYPYGCMEQTISGFVPATVVRQAFEELGLPDLRNLQGTTSDDFATLVRGKAAAWWRPEWYDLLAKELPRSVANGLSRLQRFQHEDGGWGWWDLDPSRADVTSYVVFGLALARDGQLPVDAGMLSRGRDALMKLLPVTTDADERAWILFALARSGPMAPEASEACATLAREPGDISPYGRALLVQALARLPGDDARHALAAESARQLVSLASHDEGGAAWWPVPVGREHGWTGSEVEATAHGLMAVLVALPPGDPDREQLAEGALRYLVRARRGAWWDSTKDTAAAILAATAWLREHREELSPEYDVGFAVNGHAGTTVSIGKDDVRAFQTRVPYDAALLVPGANVLTIEKLPAASRHARHGDDPSRVYWSALLTAVVPGGAQAPHAAGFALTRTWKLVRTVADGKGGWTKTAEDVNPASVALHAGDRVEVTLKVTPDRAWPFVIVEDPLPSGFEVDGAFSHEGGEGDGSDGDGGMGWGVSRREVRDDKVAFFVTQWPKGDGNAAQPQELTYTMRAEVAGQKHVQPASASLMYFPDVRGTSAGLVLDVAPQAAP